MLLKIGEMAKQAGVTVRTLQYYDKIGLLHPSGSRASGTRFYGRQDLLRLQKISSLKSIGFSLEEIAEALDNENFSLKETLKIQGKVISERIETLSDILNTISSLLTKIANEKDLTTEEVFTYIRKAKKMESIYTKEQVAIINARMEKYPEKAKEVEEAWPKLFEQFKSAKASGMDSKDPKVLLLAKKAQHYIELYTGGDPEIEANLDKAYEQNRTNAWVKWGVSNDLFDYADKSRKHYLKIRNRQK